MALCRLYFYKHILVCNAYLMCILRNNYKKEALRGFLGESHRFDFLEDN
jgi:hypothetical protein